MDKRLEDNRFIALWSKSLSDDSISVGLKYKRKLAEEVNLALQVASPQQIDQAFLVKSALFGSLGKNINYVLGLHLPLKPQSESTALKIETPFFFRFDFDT